MGFLKEPSHFQVNDDHDWLPFVIVLRRFKVHLGSYGILFFQEGLSKDAGENTFRRYYQEVKGCLSSVSSFLKRY